LSGGPSTKREKIETEYKNIEKKYFSDSFSFLFALDGTLVFSLLAFSVIFHVLLLSFFTFLKGRSPASSVTGTM